MMRILMGFTLGILFANGLPKLIRSITMDMPATPVDYKAKYQRWVDGVEVDWNEERA
jgi:hypothetical protein